MKKFEVLQESPKCDTEIQNEQMLLEELYQRTYLIQDCHKPSILKKMQLSVSAIK